MPAFDESMLVPNSALPDTRTDEEKAGDYRAEEIAAGTAVPFQHTKITTLTASVYNQWYVASCVPHGFYTQLEYEGIAPASGMSQLLAYRKRANYPSPASNGVDMYNKIKQGQSRNSDGPTLPGMTESMATAMQKVLGAALIKDFRYFQYVDASGKIAPVAIPSDVALGKAVAVFIYATEEEWSQEYVTVRDPNLSAAGAYIRHCVCLIPNGDFTENGKQWLAVHDSAQFGGRHLRYMSHDFLLKRAFFAAKVVPVGEAPQPPVSSKPTVACKLGDNSDAVRTMQTYLAANKFLEDQYVTGFYGALTAKAVLWWQLTNYKLFQSSIPQLLDLKGQSFGSQSLHAVQIIG